MTKHTYTLPSISKITVGRYSSTLGIGEGRPTISWRFMHEPHTQPDFIQHSYELRIVRPRLERDTTYSALSPNNVQIDWPEEEPALCSRELASVSVRIKASEGQWTEWTTEALETALLDRADWEADFIGINIAQVASISKQPFYTRTTFNIDQATLLEIEEQGGARLYATALGVYHLQLNGLPIGDHVLAPGWQSYNHRLHYQVYVVPTSAFRLGDNALGAIVGEGWYAGRLSWKPNVRNLWGEQLGVCVQMELGKSGPMICTRASGWTWSYGPLLASELYDGETFDASLMDPLWSSPGHSSLEWSPTICISPPSAVLIAPEAPPIRRIEEIDPVKLITTPTGKKILDFGQNIAGWVKIRHVPSRSSHNPAVTIRFAEVLEKGELGVRPLRSAKATDTIYLGSEAVTNWEPSFTTHGFRYAEVSGMGSMELSNFVAVVVHSDMERIGTFTCSNDKINQLHSNIVWGMKGNFVGVPTDCPQRDERLGWSGDLQVFAKTACYLYDTAGMLANWFHDFAEEQFKDHQGYPPLVVPEIHPALGHKWPFALGVWGDVTAFTPLDMYEAFGSTKILEEMYRSMCSWLDVAVSRRENGLWANPHGGLQLGDWLDPKAPAHIPFDGQTDPFLVTDAFLVATTGHVRDTAQLLGHQDDAIRYAAEYDRLRAAFRHEYISAAGRLGSDSQTAYALSMEFGLLDGGISSGQVKYAAARLAHLVVKNGFKIATGFAGTPVILGTLARHGYLSHAYRMLQEDACPSWLYPISMGATTMWERWDSMLPDGTINGGEMTSFNHYALGSVGNFLHTVVGGLSPASPGWKSIRIQPQPGGDITSAKTTHLTPQGIASCEWRIDSNCDETEGGSVLSVDVVIPPNCTACVVLDEGKIVYSSVGSGSHQYSIPYVPDASWPPKGYTYR